MLKTHLDYFQAVGHFADLEDLRFFVDGLTGLLPFKFSAAIFSKKNIFLGESFKFSFISPSGFRVGFNPVVSGLRAIISVPGGCLGALDQNAFVSLFSDSRWRCTRVDVALDDFDRRVSFAAVREVALKRDFAFVENYKYIESTSSICTEAVPTLYFGSPKAQKLLRFYNAEFLHDIPADRWEVQFRRSRAMVAWEEIVSNFSQTHLAGHVVGCVDFVHRDSASHLHSCKRYLWWESLRREAGDLVQLSPVTPIKTLDKTQKWLEETVSRSLAVFSDGLGTNYLNRLVSIGRSRFDACSYQSVDLLKSLNSNSEVFKKNA